MRDRIAAIIYHVTSTRCVYLAIALLGGLPLFQAANAQSESNSAGSARALEQSLEQVMQFHLDWRRTRKPLTTVNAEENAYLRSLVIDDIARSISANIRSRQSDKDAKEPKTELSFAKSLELESAFSTRNLEFPIVMAPSEEPRLGHVDCATDYQCQCSPEERYLPVSLSLLSLTHPLRTGAPIASLIESLASKVEYGKFYTCYDVVSHLDGFTQERQCRFITKLSARDHSKLISRLFAESSIPGLSAGRINELTVESAVRVSTTKHLPLDRASQYMRPIYAVADDGVIVFDELRTDPPIRCALERTFDQPIFDLSGCSDRQTCAESAVSALITSLDRHFSATPLLARLDTSEPPTRGERLYLRSYEPSATLGAPYFESSQYLLKWYLNEGGSISPPGSYTYSKGNPRHQGDYIFARIRHSLSVRAGRSGPYPEASPQQYAVYRAAVGRTMSAAVRDACNAIAGRHDGNTLCKLKEPKK